MLGQALCTAVLVKDFRIIFKKINTLNMHIMLYSILGVTEVLLEIVILSNLMFCTPF